MKKNYAVVKTISAFGLAGIAIEVECHQSVGLPSFQIVGLPSASVREAKERVESALEIAGFPLPSRRIVVNLTPAWLKKESTGLDLAIALSCLQAAAIIPANCLDSLLVWGELTLGGEIKAVETGGTLERLLRTSAFRGAILAATQRELLWNGSTGAGYNSLRELILDLRARQAALFLQSKSLQPPPKANRVLNLLRLPEALRRLICISAAGEHHMLIWGPRGVGKTHAAQFLADILPSPSAEEWELVQICHHRRALPPPERIPFRILHSSTTKAGLLGSGISGLPGELSLANGGLLLLDELLEYKRETLECLRQVMESGQIAFARAQQNLVLPARSLVYATTNTCPCGDGGNQEKICQCTPSSIRAYRRRLSYALADRFDLWWGWENAALENNFNDSTSWGDKISAARERMHHRQMMSNGRMQGEAFFKHCRLSVLVEKEWQLLCGNEGMRTKQAILRVARTLADLSDEGEIQIEHIREAAFYRLRKVLE